MVNTACYKADADGLLPIYSAHLAMYHPKEHFDEDGLCQVCDPRLQEEGDDEFGLHGFQIEEALSDSDSEASQLIAVSNNLVSNNNDEDTPSFQAGQSSSEAESDIEYFYSIPDPD